MTLSKLIAAGVLASALASAASADTILSTDFSGVATSGNTMTNIAWTTNGVADAGDLSVTSFDFNASPVAAGFHAQAASLGFFAVDLNIHNEGSWFVEVPLLVAGNGLDLDSVSFDVFSLANSGVFQQGGKRDVDITVSVIETLGGSTLYTSDFLNVQDYNASIGGPYTVTADLTGVSLSANTAYSLVLTAFSNETLGNNAGLDNLVLSGSVAAVPVPAAGLVLAGGLGALAMIRRRKA